jgi:hypothetical protein
VSHSRRARGLLKPAGHSCQYSPSGQHCALCQSPITDVTISHQSRCPCLTPVMVESKRWRGATRPPEPTLGAITSTESGRGLAAGVPPYSSVVPKSNGGDCPNPSQVARPRRKARAGQRNLLRACGFSVRRTRCYSETSRGRPLCSQG